MPSALPQPGPWRRIWRWLRWLAIGLVLVVLVPLSAVQLLLLAPRPRELVKREVIAALSAALGGGRLEIDRLDALSMVHVRLLGVRVLGKNGARLASVDRVDVALNPLTLWHKRLTVTRLSASAPWADLGAPWDEGGGLLELFQEPKSKAPPETTPSQPLGFEIAFDDLKIDHGRALLRAGGAHWRIQDLNTSLRLQLGDELALGVAGLSASVLRDERIVATLQGSDVRFADAGSAHARLEVIAGATTLSATAELESPDASGAQALRAELRARAVSPQTLASFGLDGDVLTAPIDLLAQAHGSLADRLGALDFRAQLDTPGGRIDADGRWESPRLRATLRTQRLDPGRFLRPEIAPLRARLQLQAQYDSAAEFASLKLELGEASYADTPLPAIEAEGRLGASGAVWLDSLRARYPNAELNANGRLGSSGELALTAKLNAASLAELPPVKRLGLALDGALAGDLELTRSASGTFTARSALACTRARYEELHAETLQARIEARGTAFDRPAGVLELDATRLRNARVELPRAELRVTGGPLQYAIAGRFGDRGNLQALLTRAGRGVRATGHAALTVDRNGARQPLSATIGQLEYQPDRAIVMRDVQLSYRSARATLEGRLEPKRKSRLDARLEIPDMAELTALWMAQPIAGSLRVSAAVEHSIQRPRVQLEARYRSPAFQGVKDIAVDLHGHADAAQRRLELHVDAHSHAGAIALGLKSRLRAQRFTPEAFTQGTHELDVTIDRFVPSELALWPRAAASPTRADLSGSLRARGRLEDLALSTELHAGLHFAGQPDPLELEIAGGYAQQKLDVTLDSRDRYGPLLRTRLQTELKPEQLSDPSQLVEQLLRARSWEASATFHPRRLDRLPLARILELPAAAAPAVVSAELDVKHLPGHEPAGKLTVHAGWEAPGTQIAKPSTPQLPPKVASTSTTKTTGAPRCSAGALPELELAVQIENGALRSRLTALLSGKQALVMTSDSQMFMDEWFGEQRNAIRPVEAEVTFSDLALSELPVVCEYVAGNISGHAEMSRALTQQVTSSIDLRGSALRVGEAPPFDAVIGASADRQVMDASVNLKAADGFAEISAKLPLDGSGRVPGLKLDGDVYLEAHMRKMDVRSLLAAVPQVRATEGRADADLTLTGSLRDPDLRGTIVLHELTMTMAELGQRLERTSATLALEGRSLSFKQVKIHDRDGSVELNGRLTMRQWGSFKGELQAKANDFPLRRTAAMLARFNGGVKLTADIDPRRMAFDLTLQHVRIELMDDDLSGVQSLTRNPSVVFTDARHRPELEQPAASAESSAPIVLSIDASMPFWVSRSDFSVLVSTRIKVEAVQDKVSLTGTVDLQRGYVQLLGQFFDIEQGHIEFTGGHELEPTLDLIASRKLSDGTKVGIRASGTLRAPKIAFTVDDEAVTAGEALSAASGSNYGGSDATVEQQVSSIASGLAASILNLGARPEVGGWMPVLSIDASEHGPTLRAGIEADRFIPDFLRDIVVDAYVEGIISREDGETSNGHTSNEGTGSAALLELRFPHSLVSEAQYGPSKRWSFDLSWQP